MQSNHENYSGRKIIHMNECQLFSQTNVKIALENYEFQGTMRDEMAIIVHPPFRLELEKIGALYGVHYTNEVGMVSHPNSFSHKITKYQDVFI